MQDCTSQRRTRRAGRGLETEWLIVGRGSNFLDPTQPHPQVE